RLFLQSRLLDGHAQTSSRRRWAIIAAPVTKQRGPPSPCPKIDVNLRVSFQGGSHGEYTGCGDRSQPCARRKHRIQERRRHNKGLSCPTEPVRALSRDYRDP